MAEALAEGMRKLSVAIEKPLPRHSNLYCSNLPSSVQDEESLRSLFSPYGVVETCRLVKSQRDGRNFAFVKYSTIDEAMAAISALDKAQVGSSVLEVKVADADAGDRNPELLAPPSDNLYAKNLPNALTEEELCALFSPYGTVVECRVLRPGPGRGENGAGAGALVRMADVAEATAAISHLHNQRIASSPLPLVVRFADSQEQKVKKAARQAKQYERMLQAQHLYGVSSGGSSSSQQYAQRPGYGPPYGPQPPYPPQQACYAVSPPQHQGMLQHPPPSHGGYDPYQPPYSGPPSLGGSYRPGMCSVYIKYLPAEVDKLWLYEKFAPFGGVLSVKVLTLPSGLCKGVGFINYTDPDSAQRAVTAMNGLLVSSDKRLYVALQTSRGSVGSR